MPYVRVRGVDHYYQWASSRVPAASKPVLVFLHGWGGSARYWENTARSLSDEFNCLLYDLRGFGRSQSVSSERLRYRKESDSVPGREAIAVLESEPDLDYELESYADDLAALLDMFGIEKISVNAHSMGASIATLFLNRYPERAERAILNCSGVFEYDERAFAAFYKFGGSVVKFRPSWLDRIPLLDRVFMSRFLHRPLDREVSRAFLKDFLMADADAALGTIYASVSQKSAETLPREFAQLSVPTLLISGEYDRIIPAKLGERAANLSDRIEYAIVRDTGHFPMLEDETEYLMLVRRFLKVF
jgi:pimeloyl-ACP methyl ester carboxylesterase